MRLFCELRFAEFLPGHRLRPSQIPIAQLHAGQRADLGESILDDGVWDLQQSCPGCMCLRQACFCLVVKAVRSRSLKRHCAPPVHPYEESWDRDQRLSGLNLLI